MTNKAVIDKGNKQLKSSVKLKTWAEYRQYLATHLTPSSYGPKGQPIYNAEDVAKLDIQYPDEQE